MIMTIAVALLGGMTAGYLFMDVSDKDTLDFILMTALDIMVFIAGIEIGSNRGILKRVCNWHGAVLALSIPAAVAVGSIGGAALIGMAVGLSFYDAVLVGSGLGWYSFSSVVISAMYSTEIGTVSFLANMLRELSAFFLIPVLVRFHKLLALAPSGAATMDSKPWLFKAPCWLLAPSGAATMDSGLPVVIKYTNLHVGMYSFINGLVLTLIVPVLLSWLLSLK